MLKPTISHFNLEGSSWCDTRILVREFESKLRRNIFEEIEDRIYEQGPNVDLRVYENMDDVVVAVGLWFDVGESIEVEFGLDWLIANSLKRYHQRYKHGFPHKINEFAHKLKKSLEELTEEVDAVIKSTESKEHV
ncbi:hypothetical protein EBT25_15955 [bacterium]|jgi:hypothetical protein|nr:hypothetical protein [bacterium]